MSNKLTNKDIINFASNHEITMTKWQMHNFVEGEGITRWRRVRQLILEIENRQGVLIGFNFSKEELLGTVDMLKEEIEETNSEGQERINHAKIARHDWDLAQLERGVIRTNKELTYFLELIHELDIDKDYLDNFYKIENEEDRDYYIRILCKQAATEITAYGRMGTGNTSSILMMNKEDQQLAMQGALTLQKSIDNNMALIDRKIDANMPLSLKNENNIRVLENSQGNK